MTPFSDLEQFRTLAGQLPDGGFAASGILHPRISLFASTHAGGDPQAMRDSVNALPENANFTAAVARADADLRLYELAIDYPLTELDPQAATHLIAFGMTAIEPGPDLFALGTLVDTPSVLRTLTAALAAQAEDPLAVLARQGGRETCALLGAIMAARMAECPVILDGAAALAAATALRALNPAAITHCAVPAGSAVEDAARRMGLTIAPCHDPRPLASLAASILPCRALAIT